MRTYFWDFFGPNATPTAEHFMRHLDEFLVINGYAGCTTGVVSSGANHHAVFCKAAPEWEHSIESSLKPRRVTEEDS